MSKKHNIKKNAMISFEYRVYDQGGQLISEGVENNMIVGNDTLFPNLSKSLLTLDSTIDEHAFNFDLKNENSVENVIFNLTILNYEENFQSNTNEFDTNSTLLNKNNKNNKKEEKILKNKIVELEKNIKDLKINELILNSKIVEISNKAQQQILKFKEDAKKKHELEMSDLKNYQFQNFFEKILNPLNNLYMAIEFGVKQSENPELVGYIKGFELLINQMFNILTSFGVSTIEPQVGDEFNPEFHNIVELVQTKEFSKDKIVELRSRGYELNGRVIMPANVLVSKK